MTGLRADVRLRLGRLALDVVVEAGAGSVTAVVGPNGAGKTTFLRAVAGQVGIDGGEIRLGATVLDAPPGVFVPPERRRLGYVDQDYLLFPHLTALENIAFGPRSAGATRAGSREIARAWLERVGLGDRADARRRSLSGGQQQRVALARALATDPQALLLDEPLAALDVRTRPEVRRDLRRHLGGYDGVTLIVTHDLADAAALADRMLVLEDGRVTHAGTVAEVLARPRTSYVADLVGTNLLHGTGDGSSVTVDGVRLPVPLPAPLLASAPGPVLVTVRPADVVVVPLEGDRPDLPPVDLPAVDAAEAAATPAPSGRWRARIVRIELAGDIAEVLLDRPTGLVAAVPLAEVVAGSLREGSEVLVGLRRDGRFAAYEA